MHRVPKLFLPVALTLILAGVAAEVRGQQPAPSAASAATPTPSTTTTPAATPTPTPIPLAEVVTQAEATTLSLRDTEADLSFDQTITTIEEELPVLAREIDARLEENSMVLAPSPSLETLRNLEAGWQKVGNNLTAWARSLTTSANRIDRKIADSARLEETWKQTLALAQNSEGTPPEVLSRIEAVIAATRQTRGAVERQRTQVLTLQNRVAAQDARVAAALTSVRQAREEAVNRLFVRESPPIWSAEVRARAGQNLIGEFRNSLAAQWAALGTYAGGQREKFFLHVMVIILLAAALYWVRRRVQPWVEEEPSLKRAALVFDVPVAAAFVLSIVVGGWIYPQAPLLWQASLGAAALIPTIIILRRLAERHLLPVLNALVVFYFVDLLRTVTDSVQLVSRVLFLAEMLGGILFLAWLVKSARLSKVPEKERDRLWKTIRTAARVASVLFAAAFIANALGYVSLANLVGTAVLGSAYIAIIFYAATKIADGLSMFALRVRPLVLLGMVREHRPLFRRRVRRVLQVLAFLLWLYYTLELLSLRAPLVERIRNVLTANLVVGSLDVSLGNVLAFGITVWAAFLLSRFAHFVLEEDVYPRLTLARGVPYAVSTMLRYVILLVGFFVAVAALGIDMTKFTILAGAFGVGLGFGLQNIFNNFVSGLIVLFERPIKVGDVVQLNDATGVVKSIGIRASVISTVDGSDIIVPNGKMISDSVTNWTFSSSRRSFVIRVGAAYGTDPRRVIELLGGVARVHPLVVADPPPQAVFVGFGSDSLDFELRVWTDHSDEWTQIRSDLAVAINTAFVEGNISMPYPRRDLHLRSIDPEALEAIVNHGSARTNGSDLSTRAMTAPKSGNE